MNQASSNRDSESEPRRWESKGLQPGYSLRGRRTWKPPPAVGTGPGRPALGSPSCPVFAGRSVTHTEWGRRGVLTMLTPLLWRDDWGHFHCRVRSALLIYALSRRSISPVIVMFPLVISVPLGPEIAGSWGWSPKCSPGNCSCKYSQSKPNKVSESLFCPEAWELYTKIVFQNMKQKAHSNNLLELRLGLH